MEDFNLEKQIEKVKESKKKENTKKDVKGYTTILLTDDLSTNDVNKQYTLDYSIDSIIFDIGYIWNCYSKDMIVSKSAYINGYGSKKERGDLIKNITLSIFNGKFNSTVRLLKDFIEDFKDIQGYEKVVDVDRLDLMIENLENIIDQSANEAHLIDQYKKLNIKNKALEDQIKDQALLIAELKKQLNNKAVISEPVKTDELVSDFSDENLSIQRKQINL